MLSDRRIRALKPAPRDKWYCDGNGLYLRVRATGGRSWVLRRKRGGHIEVITLGAWPALGLAEARQKAGALAGKDVSTLTLGALLDTWHADIVRKTYRRPREVQGYIERLDPPLKATKLRNLERVEVRHALRHYAEERGPIAANRACRSSRPPCASPSTPGVSRSPRSIACPASSSAARKSRATGC
jgi:hypothetical protein